ncbi:MAG TPA: hypothetical protein VER03_17940 [Bryobacteraceae bacterium]|nr:hypothetical protein [Bryobacteraceae bacterium]
MKQQLLAMFTTVAMLCASAWAQPAPAGGGVNPPGGDSAPKTAGELDAKTLLASTDAETAATYRCATSDSLRGKDLEADLKSATDKLPNLRATIKQSEELLAKALAAEALAAKALAAAALPDEALTTKALEAKAEAERAKEQVEGNKRSLSEEEAAIATLKAKIARLEAKPPVCPLTEALSQDLKRHFHQPLMQTDGKPSPLAVALTTLLKGSFGAEPVAPPDIDDIIIHLVDRQGAAAAARSQRGEAAAEGKAAAVLADAWILARRKGDGFSFTKKARIFGSRRIALVFVHLNAITAATEPAEDRYADVSYRAIVQGKLPINVSRLLGILDLAGALQSKALDRTVAYMGLGVLNDVAVPSDVTVFGVDISGTEPPRLIASPKKYDNEGKYFWDVSLAVPVNKISLVEYSEENRTYFPKQINKQSVYALINIYPWLVDIKGGRLQYILPRAVAGFGLTGRPGENFLLGGSWGIQELQFFVGSGFANQRALIPGADPNLGTSYQQRYASRLTYGLNIPIIGAVNWAKAKAKSK